MGWYNGNLSIRGSGICRFRFRSARDSAGLQHTVDRIGDVFVEWKLRGLDQRPLFGDPALKIQELVALLNDGLVGGVGVRAAGGRILLLGLVQKREAMFD